jgi:hypothetical protein
LLQHCWQVPPQFICPDGQHFPPEQLPEQHWLPRVQVPPVPTQQLPPTQACPALQALPHVPQFITSIWVFVQVPLQQVLPVGFALQSALLQHSRQTPKGLLVLEQAFWPVGHTHWFDALQVAPTGQQVFPQTALVVVSQQNF